ncbi:hypothetical protein B0H66DRAFT_16416 [Apodospora peruviana]|uniref:C2H2-type domain-containing protein n=1 Tax=Apodospora peruviana TaxID=516989 RepID=A0AAE0IQ71_9PEZI|nr:hypothetical protein B0H66DRAFT_16416 [Apodospora peruviana]
MDIHSEDIQEINLGFLECKALFRDCLALAVFAADDWLEDRSADFNVWAFSIGADNIGKSSLDYRLRNWHDVRSIIVGLLAGLRDTLARCVDEVERSTRKGTTRRTSSYTASSLVEKVPDIRQQQPATATPVDVWSDFSDSSDDGNPRSSLAPSGDSDLLQREKTDIATTIDQLVRISVAIRKSGNKRRMQIADDSFDETKPEYQELNRHLVFIILQEHFDLTKVPNPKKLNQMIDNASQLTSVQRRLLRANLLRRHRIRHAARFNNPPKVPVPAATEGSKQAGLVGKFFPNLSRKPSEQAEESTAHAPTGESSKTPSQVAAGKQLESVGVTSFTATDLGSQFKIPVPKQPPSAMTRVSRVGARQTYPKCPATQGTVFNCPYCSQALPGDDFVAKASRWRVHVADDILPYVCIFEECEQADEFYATSDEWYTHMRNNHATTRWPCDICAPPTPNHDVGSSSNNRQGNDEAVLFETDAEWMSHVSSEHQHAFPSPQIPVLAELARRRVLLPLVCPLCGGGGDTEDDNNHVASHLHEFALRSLPPVENADGSASADSFASTGLQSGGDVHSSDFGSGASDGDTREPQEGGDNDASSGGHGADPNEKDLRDARKAFTRGCIAAHRKLEVHFRNATRNPEQHLDIIFHFNLLTNSYFLRSDILDRLSEEELGSCSRSFAGIVAGIEEFERPTPRAIRGLINTVLRRSKRSERVEGAEKKVQAECDALVDFWNRKFLEMSLGPVYKHAWAGPEDDLLPQRKAQEQDRDVHHIRICTRLARRLFETKLELWSLRTVSRHHPSFPMLWASKTRRAMRIIGDIQKEVEYLRQFSSSWSGQDVQELHFIADILPTIRVQFEHWITQVEDEELEDQGQDN